MCTEYPLEATPKLQSGVGFEGGNGSHTKHYGQRRFRVRTSAGSNMNTTREVADVRKPLISASHLLQRGHKLVLDEKPRIQCKNGDIVPLQRTGSTVVDSEWFSQARPSTSRVKKKESLQHHTLKRARETHTLFGLSLMQPTGSMLAWTSLLTLTDLEERHSEHGARVGSATNSDESRTHVA